MYVFFTHTTILAYMYLHIVNLYVCIQAFMSVQTCMVCVCVCALSLHCMYVSVYVYVFRCMCMYSFIQCLYLRGRVTLSHRRRFSKQLNVENLQSHEPPTQPAVSEISVSLTHSPETHSSQWTQFLLHFHSLRVLTEGSDSLKSYQSHQHKFTEYVLCLLHASRSISL